jgi:adenine specific DNA methylase Mod
MPSLTWIGKEAVVKHHKDVPYRLLEPNPDLSCPPQNSGNLIVQGDNLHALKALLPRYAGQVKCIYIDPPYNTGVDERDREGRRTGWIYSDSVNSPEIRAWLNKVVGPEIEDLSRHDKWLCMMFPRLHMLRDFLREDGVIFVSIDEIEYGNLRALMDEIYGIQNRIGTIIWNNATDNNKTNVAIEHEYLLCYSKNKKNIDSEWKSENLEVKNKLLERQDYFLKNFQDSTIRQKEYTKWFRENKFQLWPFQDYKYIDDNGIYTGMRAVHNPGKEGYRYDVIHPVTGKACQQPMMGYRFPPDTMKKLIENNKIIYGVDETKIIELKIYASEYRLKLSSIFELDGRVGTNEIKSIFPENKRPFDFPKPTSLIEEILSFTTSENDIVLDSFSGSGTTGHAVLKLNRLDSQKRKFILIEMHEEIAKNVTAERMKRVIDGYIDNRGERIAGLGGGFQFCTLSDTPLFTETGAINPEVKFPQLAEFVWFVETGSAFTGRSDSPLLGVHEGRAIYLLYNGILKDKSEDGGNVLTMDIFKNNLPPFDGPKVIYAAANRMGSQAAKGNITFKQTPYALEV